MIIMQQLSVNNGRLVTVLRGQAANDQDEFGRGVLLTRLDDKVSQVEKFDANCAQLPEFEFKRGFEL
jgi:hypothetical protein